MADHPSDRSRQDRRLLPPTEQPHTARELQRWIDDPDDQALVLGPIPLRYERLGALLGRDVFRVPGRVRIVVEQGGRPSEVLGEGRYDSHLWPDLRQVRLHLVRCDERRLDLAFSAPVEWGAPEPTVQAIKLRYSADPEYPQRLLRRESPVRELAERARAICWQAAYPRSPTEAEQLIDAALAHLRADERALGFTIYGLAVERWGPPVGSAGSLLVAQVGALRERGGLEHIGFRADSEYFFVQVPLVPERAGGLVATFYCTASYPYVAPQVSVSTPDEPERPYECALLASWMPTNTLHDLVESVKQDYKHL